MWVPMVENNSFNEKGGQYFIEKYIDELFDKEPRIDTLILACTHYPILKDSILKFLPAGVNLIEQGDLVAKKLKNYLSRHPKLNNLISANSSLEIQTTENSQKFDSHLRLFYGDNLKSSTVSLD
jgi:glutamate racemase